MKRVLLFGACFCALKGAELSSDQLAILRDSGGWQYLSITDPHAGVQTTHTCFDGTPHPQSCSGTLTLDANGTFTEQTVIHRQSTSRRGTYVLTGNQITFADELGTSDGPYQLDLRPDLKSMSLQIGDGAAAAVHMELELDSEYRKQLAAVKRP